MRAEARRVTSKAVVQVTADASKFAADVERTINAALRHVDLNLDSVARQIGDGLQHGVDEGTDAFKDIDDEFDRAMAEINRSADEHFERVARDADEAADQFWHDFDGAGEKVEDSLGEVGDKSKREFDRVEHNARDSASGIGSTFKRMAAVLLTAFAGIQIGRFFLNAAQDAEDLGSAIANTEQIIKSTHGAAGLLAQDIREISRQLSLKIGVDSVEVQNAANILLTFKGVSKSVFPEAIGLAADLSAVLGSDLAGATLQLGKALNDPVRGIAALARAGVQFTDKQKATIKSLVASNNLLGAQAIILKEVKSQVGGVAIAGADTTDKLKVAFQDLKREAGEALIDFIDKSGPQMIGILEKLGPVVGLVGGAIADALTAVLPIIDVLATNFRDNFAQLAPAVEPLAEILKSVLEILPKVVPLLVQIGQTILPPLAAAVSAVVIAIGPLIGLIVKLASDVLTALAPALAPIGAALTQVAVVAGGALMTALPDLADATLRLVVALLPLVPLAADLLVALLPLAQPIVDIAVAIVQLAASISGPLSAVTGFLAKHSDAVLVAVAAFTAYKLAVFAIEAPLLILKAALVATTAAEAAFNLVLALNPIGLVVAAIVLLVGGLILAWKHSEAFRKVVLAVWGAIKIAASAIGDAFVAAFHAVVDFFAGLGRFFADLPGRLLSFLINLPAMIGNLLLAAGEAGLKAIGIGIGLILAAIIGLPLLIIAGLNALPGLLADFFSLLWEGLVAAFHAGIDLLVFAVTELPGKVLGALAAFGTLLGDLFASAWKAAGHAVVSGITAIVGFVLSLPTRIRELGPLMLAAGKALIKGFFDGLAAVGGFLADVGGAVLRGLKAGLNAVINVINSGIAKVDDALPFDLPRIPTLARGGLTQDGGLAVLHPREMVLPLEDRRAVDLLGAALAEADAGLRATGVKPSQDAGDLSIRIFLGTREITDIVNVQIDERNRELKRRVTAGTGRSSR